MSAPFGASRVDSETEEKGVGGGREDSAMGKERWNRMIDLWGAVGIAMLMGGASAAGESSNVELVGRALFGPAGAVETDGVHTFVGTESALLVFDADQELVAWVETEGEVQDLVLAGAYAYVTSHAYFMSGGLHAIDVSDPRSPFEVGFYDTGGYSAGVAVSGDHAYVVGANGFRVADLSDVAAPVPVGYTKSGAIALNVVATPDYAYVAHAEEGLKVIDVRDPVNPVVVGSLDTGGVARDVAVSGEIVDVVDSATGLHSIDVTDATNPIEIGLYRGGWTAVVLSAEYAYVLRLGQLSIVDVSDPANPHHMGAFDPWGEFALRDVAVSDEHAYLATSDGLLAIDVADPANPVELNASEIEHGLTAVAVADGYVYAVNLYHGLHVFDLSDPADPVEVGFYDERLSNVWNVSAAGDRAYVVDYHNGLYILQFTPTAIEGDLPPPSPPTRTALGLSSPNPFNPRTTIPIELAREGHATLALYDIVGHLVRVLVDRPLAAGRHRFVWDGRDRGGSSVASGVYVARFRAGGEVETQRLVLLR